MRISDEQIYNVLNTIEKGLRCEKHNVHNAIDNLVTLINLAINHDEEASYIDHLHDTIIYLTNEIRRLRQLLIDRDSVDHERVVMGDFIVS